MMTYVATGVYVDPQRVRSIRADGENRCYLMIEGVAEPVYAPTTAAQCSDEVNKALQRIDEEWRRTRFPGGVKSVPC